MYDFAIKLQKIRGQKEPVPLSPVVSLGGQKEPVPMSPKKGEKKYEKT